MDKNKKALFDRKINDCNTFKDLVNVFEEFFDLDKIKVGYITKRIISNNLMNVIKGMNVKAK